MELVLDILINRHKINELEIIQLQMTNKAFYMFLYKNVKSLYKAYIKSDKYRQSVIHTLNYTSRIIDEFRHNNKILSNMIFDYIILCYENWHWLTMNEHYRARLNIPQALHFKAFLNDRQISISDILPNVHVTYTHFHRPTKSFSYYKTNIHSLLN
jgi:hypothetical protein